MFSKNYHIFITLVWHKIEIFKNKTPPKHWKYYKLKLYKSIQKCQNLITSSLPNFIKVLKIAYLKQFQICYFKIYHIIITLVFNFRVLSNYFLIIINFKIHANFYQQFFIIAFCFIIFFCVYHNFKFPFFCFLENLNY